MKKTKLPYDKKLVLYAGLAGLGVLALVLRFTLLKFKSEDYVLDLAPWYGFLQAHGVHGLKYNFSNYNLPYLYLLLATTVLHLPKIVAIKGISILFDLLMSYGVFLIVKHFKPKDFTAYFAALITLFLPTVFINSAMWGQSDSTYTAFLVFSFYFILKKRYSLMWLMWALAFAFKLQAIFFLPLVLLVSFRRQTLLKSWVCLPTFFILMLPALVVGRPLGSILKIYTSQVGFYHSLTMHAANLYQWIPNQLYSYFNGAGIVLTTALVLFIGLLAYYHDKFSDQEILLTATLILLVVPFFLPQMHERYFYPAEIFVLLAAFTQKRLSWYVPLLQFVTFCAYTPFLFKVQPVLPLGIVAIFTLVIISHLTYNLFIKDGQKY